MSLLLSVALASAQVIVLLGIWHWLWPLLVVGRRSPRARISLSGRSPRLVVLVAARNEAAVIASLLTALASQTLSRECFDVHVVADGCTDATAAIARRAGATVWERPAGPGSTKGDALRWLWTRLAPTGLDGVVLFDADNAPDPECLAELARAMAAGAQVVQGLRVPVSASPGGVARWDGLGELCQQWIGSRARARLGVSVPILGSGVAFRADRFAWLLARSHPATLVEDADWMVQLALAGITVHWCPEARVRDDKTANWEALKSQRRRWLGGRWRLLKAQGGALLWAALRHARIEALDVWLQLVAPPRMVLGVGALGFAMAGHLGAPVWPVWDGVLLASVVYVLVGWRLSGAMPASCREVWQMVLALPRFAWELLAASWHAWLGRAVVWQVTPKGRS